MALTPEEIQEMKELEELEQLEAMEAGQQDFTPTQEDMDKAQAAVEPSAGEALAGGFIEGVPFLKDAVAAYDGISDAIEKDNVNFDTAYSNYKEQLDETNTDLTNAQKQSPWTFAGGEIGATALGMVAGGAALKAGGAGATLTNLGVSTVAASGVGAAQQLSRSRDRSPTDVIVGGAIGAAAEFGGHHMMQGVKKGGRYLLDKADDMGANAVKKLLGIGNVATKKSFFKHLSNTNQKESQFLDDVLTQRMKDSDEAVINFSEKPELMMDKIKVAKHDIGARIGKSYKEVDAAHKVEIDIEKLKGGLIDDVVAPFSTSDDPGMNVIGEQLEDYVQKIGTSSKGAKKEVTNEGVKLIEETVTDKSWNLSRVHGLQKDIRRRIENIYRKNGLDLTADKEQQRQVASSLGRHMDDILDSVSSDADDIIGKIKKDRLSFGNMSTIEESIQSEIFKAKDDPVSVLKEAISLRSLFISGAATSAMGPVGLVAGPMINRVIASPKTPLYLSQGLKALGTVVSAAPTGKVATKLNSAALMNNKRFKDALYGTIADVNLSQRPLPRTAEAAMQRQEDLRNIIRDKQPSVLPMFEKAMESGDQGKVGYLLDTASKIEGSEKYFEDGIGFDGIVYNPEDKAMLLKELNKLKGQIPASQRTEMRTALEGKGIIPNLEEVVQPPQKVHIPKKKKQHDY